MMTVQLDMTSELAAIPYGVAIALAVSLLGVLAGMSREQIRLSKRSLLAAYHHYAWRLRRMRALPWLPTPSRAR